MTIAQAYTLYCAVYREYDRIHGSAFAARAGMSPVARVVAEFAESDAQNGTGLRTAGDFARCLRLGADALAALGLRAA